MTTFQWIISETGESDASYAVSSSSNPFALTFSNATLTLVNAGLSNEAFSFQVSMDKEVIPRTALTSDNSATACYYDGTTFSAMLYTQMNATYPTGGASQASPSPEAFQEWPHAVSVQQVIGGGMDVPSCYKTVNGNKGDSISIDTEPAQSNCRCSYQNYGT